MCQTVTGYDRQYFTCPLGGIFLGLQSAVSQEEHFKTHKDIKQMQNQHAKQYM